MLKKHLNSYKGKLSNKQIADGINAARRNARRLAEDAQMLLEAYRYPTAASLAILSVEESGKEHIIRDMATATTGAEGIAKLERLQISHKEKYYVGFPSASHGRSATLGRFQNSF